MVKKLILFVSVIFFYNSVFAQQNSQQYSYNVLKSNTPAIDSRIEVASNGDTILISKYVYQNPTNFSRQYFEKSYKGTPFFQNNWNSGQLFFEDGSVVKGTLAYNLISNLVYYSLGNISDAVEAKPLGFTINNITFKKLSKDYENLISGYFQTIVADKKVELLRQFVCVYHPQITGERVGYEAEGGPYEGSYDKSDHLFLGYNKSIVELKTNNGIYKQFGEYRSAVEKFSKENMLNPKNEGDVIKLVVFFSSLIEKFEK